MELALPEWGLRDFQSFENLRSICEIPLDQKYPASSVAGDVTTDSFVTGIDCKTRPQKTSVL
jgi:hypothetical protein